MLNQYDCDPNTHSPLCTLHTVILGQHTLGNLPILEVAAVNVHYKTNLLLYVRQYFTEKHNYHLTSDNSQLC